MQERYTAQEYAEKMQVNISTVYRWIKQGNLATEKNNGVLHILTDSEKIPENMQNNIVIELRKQVVRLEKENDDLRALVQKMQSDLESTKERSDTIVLQLTQQQQLLIEDLRQRQGVWQRMKAKLRWGTV